MHHLPDPTLSLLVFSEPVQFPPRVCPVPAKAVDKESNRKRANHATNGEDGHTQGPEGGQQHLTWQVFEPFFQSVVEKVPYDLQDKMHKGGQTIPSGWEP